MIGRPAIDSDGKGYIQMNPCSVIHRVIRCIGNCTSVRTAIG